jgi:hypothetical protein
LKKPRKKSKPKKPVNIFGKIVPVYLAKDLVTDQPVFGCFDPATWTIYLDDSQTKPELLETLIHEMGHALMQRLYLVGVIDPKIIEIIVEGYTHVMIENFKLTKR